MKPTIVSIPEPGIDTTQPQTLLAEDIAVWLETHKDAPRLVLLSGGSSLMMLDSLTDLIEENSIPLSDTTFGFVDERFDPEHSNYVRMKHEYGEFGRVARTYGAAFLDSSPHEKDQFAMATWYEQALGPYLHDEDVRSLALMGMGEDGHIAGILPLPNDKKTFDERYVDTDKLVVPLDATGINEHTKRFSMTYPALSLVETFRGFVVGTKKKEKLVEALDGSVAYHINPASYWATLGSKLILYTDIQLQK